MWANKNQTGFTIVETLIVMAVIGVLFVSTAAVIQGQVNKYQSRDAVLQLETVVRNTLNDVSNGYYPDTGKKLQCTLSGGGVNATTVSMGGLAIGTNPNCVYAGKKIVFGPTKILISSMAGPSADTSLTFSHISPISGLDETKPYQWGVRPTSSSSGATFYLLNTSYAAATNSLGSFSSGVQNVGIFDSAGNQLTSNKTICFVNGRSNSALILSDDGSLQVSSAVKSSCT